MCMSLVTIVIEFASDGWTRQPDPPTLPGLLIRLVESRTDATRAFTLMHGTQSVYTLTVDETDELLRLLGKMVVGAPWQAMAGFDGCTYTLILKGPMSGITFSWWVEVPQGWESIGAVSDFVMSLADRFGISRWELMLRNQVWVQALCHTACRRVHGSAHGPVGSSKHMMGVSYLTIKSRPRMSPSRRPSHSTAGHLRRRQVWYNGIEARVGCCKSSATPITQLREAS